MEQTRNAFKKILLKYFSPIKEGKSTMTVWVGMPIEKKGTLIKNIINKYLVSIFVFAFCLLFSDVIIPKAIAQDDIGSVFIKDFEFSLPYRPPETEAAKLLKQRHAANSRA